MAFNVTWTGLNDKNIKHLYSTKDPEFRVRKSRLYNPLSLSLELSLRESPVRQNNRLFEYDQRYGASLPRAPAFRAVSNDYVHNIVKRLSQPNPIKKSPRECQHYQRSFADYKFEEEEPGDETRRSRSQIRGIVSRLIEPISCGKMHYSLALSENAKENDLTPVAD